MSKKRSNRRTKKKKKKEADLMRTDVWSLVATQEQKHQMQLTVNEYRAFLTPLVLIFNAQWAKLATLSSTERINAVEKMIHATAKNPAPKHNYYQKVLDKNPSFRKFPSYLRRAAIADAIGIVSSFQTRYREWQSGIRKHRQARPPRLTAMCKSYPALYQGQQIKYGVNYATVDIKVWDGTDWVWLKKIKVKKHGGNRHLTKGNQLCSPALVIDLKKCQLSMPVEVKQGSRQEAEYICSVDLGINNAAVAAIVGRDGTVKARKFINPARDIDCRNRRRMKIAKKAKQTSNITGKKLPRGFCKGLYRKSSNLNLEIGRTVAREIVKFALLHGVKVIVLENLSGWKAKAGKKGSLMKQKFHLWCHSKICELINDKWTEVGGVVQTINPKYTSAVAFDGSGKVLRSKINYSLAKFSTGKRYHADLNASYNIGARYWYSVIVGDRHFSRVFDSKSSNGTSRTPIVLGTLRSLATFKRTNPHP
ncbi:MAG: IS200/IS605 family element transposase accessory protein TnpB [Moorea sp. SIOASIH]|uniref:transposase n=1 Tax=Moorena sp. SIOASIH TaxID=2607817 RepID=UPI0013BB236F|nr:transposase [Moorena sp. SIOASIH]NEO39069.1 IS200/IS605 family element transposase accessory protein TnpB [Moorena sp. SIOASIH]